ncbi:MAG: hypothetical protein Q7S31_02070 [bacterium]|nr:hypothetical protein [bacterium]
MVNTKWITDNSLTEGYLMYAISPEIEPVAAYTRTGAKQLLYIADDASAAHDLFGPVAIREKVLRDGETFEVLIVASLKAKERFDKMDPYFFQPA